MEKQYRRPSSIQEGSTVSIDNVSRSCELGIDPHGDTCKNRWCHYQNHSGTVAEQGFQRLKTLREILKKYSGVTAAPKRGIDHQRNPAESFRNTVATTAILRPGDEEKCFV